MAKYYISADLEGVCGVTSLLQCYPKSDLTGYHTAVRQLASEINAVCETILSCEPDAEILVNDAHSTMANLSQEMLLPNVGLLSGKPKVCAMMSGLDKSFDGVILIGYHAKAGAEKGVLNHTFHGKLFDVNINGQPYGEGEINALYAGLVYQVPVLLASGDRAFCQEINAFLPQVKAVETKIGLTTTAAESHPLSQVMADYRSKTKAALTEPKTSPALLKPPFTLTVTFINTLACDVAMTSPLYQRLDGRTLQMVTDDFAVLYRGLQSAYTMLCYTDFME